PSGCLDCIVELLVHRRFQGRDLLGTEPRCLESPFVQDDRVLTLPGLYFRLCPVSLGVTFIVAVPAVRAGFDDGGTSSVTDRFDHTRHGGGGRRDVVAIDCDVVDVVPSSSALEGC